MQFLKCEWNTVTITSPKIVCDWLRSCLCLLGMYLGQQSNEVSLQETEEWKNA